MDPFFKNRNRSQNDMFALPWGSPYLKDIMKTYTHPNLPERDDERFQRAYEFREKEKAAVQDERKQWKDQELRMQYELNVAKHYSKSLEEQNRKQKEQLQKFSSFFNELNSKISSSKAKSNVEQQAKEAIEDGDDVPREVLPATVPDPRGHAAEHGTEGRLERAGDVEGGV